MLCRFRSLCPFVCQVSIEWNFSVPFSRAHQPAKYSLTTAVKCEHGSVIDLCGVASSREIESPKKQIESGF